MNLLPAIPLYRRLLRMHRQKLSIEERLLGDSYLKSEFRRHKDIENPLHIVGFLQQWQQYGEVLNKKDINGEGQEWLQGADDWAMEGLLEKMNDQQVGQLWELYEAIQKVNRGETVEAHEDEPIALDADKKDR